MKRTIAAVVFPEFEMLDLYGPLEMFSYFRDDFEIRTVALQAGPVVASGGPVKKGGLCHFCLHRVAFAGQGRGAAWAQGNHQQAGFRLGRRPMRWGGLAAAGTVGG